ncbi:hypothetical protein SPHV1_360051 [Novosphingobium sp. KN65.2]|nr:hypothetical protein SPHV1_360051 [Novosphingobium sp. KN65.2]
MSALPSSSARSAGRRWQLLTKTTIRWRWAVRTAWKTARLLLSDLTARGRRESVRRYRQAGICGVVVSWLATGAPSRLRGAPFSDLSGNPFASAGIDPRSAFHTTFPAVPWRKILREVLCGLQDRKAQAAARGNRLGTNCHLHLALGGHRA